MTQNMQPRLQRRCEGLYYMYFTLIYLPIEFIGNFDFKFKQLNQGGGIVINIPFVHLFWKRTDTIIFGKTKSILFFS